jgi:hypothetical protein
MNSFERALVGDTQEALGRTLEDLDDAHQEIDRLSASNLMLYKALSALLPYHQCNCQYQSPYFEDIVTDAKIALAKARGGG